MTISGVAPREHDAVAAVSERAGRGSYPLLDALTEVVPPPSTAPAALFSVTGHYSVAADIEPERVHQVRPQV